jgi:hypothetical protein
MEFFEKKKPYKSITTFEKGDIEAEEVVAVAV